MDYVKLGRTGLEVSRLCLGCMTFGVPDRGTHPWTLDEDAEPPDLQAGARARHQLLRHGQQLLRRHQRGDHRPRSCGSCARRDEIVVATKVFFPTGARARTPMGLSRKAIFQGIDASLRRLGMDYVDLYQIHRWDDACRSRRRSRRCTTWSRPGKARYIGASSMYAWQFARRCSCRRGTAGRASSRMQNHVNLLYREEEREMLPLCRAEGIGVIPWSPLARGRLTRDWHERTEREDTDEAGKRSTPASRDADRAVIDAVARSPRRVAFRGPRSRWPGCCSSPASPRRSSARRGKGTSTTRSPRSTCG